MTDLGAIASIVDKDLAGPVPDAVTAASDALRQRHSNGIDAILFYGSCLRDGKIEGRIVDFYVLVDSYRNFHGDALKAFVNFILPPNVYYAEVPYAESVVRIKYTVFSSKAFRRGTKQSTLQPTIWARFCQPSAIVFTRTDEIRRQLREDIVRAVTTMAHVAAPLLPESFTSQQFWVRAFSESYGAELRAERADRPMQIYESDRERYDRLSAALFRAADAPGHFRNPCSSSDRLRERLSSILRRIEGKSLNAARVVKAAFTFEGGLDYILWKVESHSGVRITPSPWQSRHPVLAAPVLAWQLYRAGAFR